MLVHIPKLISAALVAEIRTRVANEEFTDGRLTAGGTATNVKNNLQLRATTEACMGLNRLITDALLADKRFWNLTFYKQMAQFTFSHYKKGMYYGLHLDNPFPKTHDFRSDISMTLFLNKPSDYEGGELVIQSDYGSHVCKAEEGDAVIYPSNLLHEVTPVTSGERLVAITWMQSLIREPARRRILLDMTQLIGVLEKENSSNILLAQKSYNNLLRMWCDT